MYMTGPLKWHPPEYVCAAGTWDMMDEAEHVAGRPSKRQMVHDGGLGLIAFRSKQYRVLPLLCGMRHLVGPLLPAGGVGALQSTE